MWYDRDQVRDLEITLERVGLQEAFLVLVTVPVHQAVVRLLLDLLSQRGGSSSKMGRGTRMAAVQR